MNKLLLLPLTLTLAGLAFCADEAPKAAEPGTLVVIDSAGKEQKIKAWKFTSGVRRLGWLATQKANEPPPETDKGKEKGPRPLAPTEDGPPALVVRDETKIHFLAGVTTLVPIERIRSISFDNDKERMTVRVAVSAKPEDDVTLEGTTAYKGINKVSIEADVDRGELGVASLTYQGGTPKGIRGIRFPEPKVHADKPGRPAVVQTADRDVKKTHKVDGLMPLYVFKGGREKTAPTLMFKKTLRLDVAKIAKIHASGEDSDDTVWQVTPKGGDEETLTLLPTATIDGLPGQLAGMVGKVPGGYKLFPLRRIAAVTFDTSDAPKEKDKDKEKEK
jgi:hypothetical protein